MEQVLRGLVRDLARDIDPTEKILERYKLTRKEYDEIANTRAFKTEMQLASIEWGSIGNTQERVKLKAAIVIEDVLPDMAGMLRDKKESLHARARLFAELAKVGALGQAPMPTEASKQVFRLEIDLSDGTAKPQSIVIEHEVLPPTVRPMEERFLAEDEIL